MPADHTQYSYVVLWYVMSFVGIDHTSGRVRAGGSPHLALRRASPRPAACMVFLLRRWQRYWFGSGKEPGEGSAVAVCRSPPGYARRCGAG